MTFLVFNPARGLPTRSHFTLERATAEAERLTLQNPGQRFYVMAPVISEGDARAAKAFGHGVREGLSQAHDDVVRAERAAERFSDKHDDLLKEVEAYRKCDAIRHGARKYQAIVADALLWFKGFAAAHVLKETWERPSIPDLELLRELNGRLQDIDPSVPEFEEIPF